MYSRKGKGPKFELEEHQHQQKIPAKISHPEPPEAV